MAEKLCELKKKGGGGSVELPAEVYCHNGNGAGLSVNMVTTQWDAYNNTYIILDGASTYDLGSEYIRTANLLQPAAKKACHGYYRTDNDPNWHEFNATANQTICTASKGVIVMVYA